jgi:hypothetical protein
MEKYLDWYNLAMYLIIALGSSLILAFICWFMPLSWGKVLLFIFFVLVILTALDEWLWEVQMAKALHDNDSRKVQELFNQKDLRRGG